MLQCFYIREHHSERIFKGAGIMVYGYCRVSTRGQATKFSLEQQKQEIQQNTTESQNEIKEEVKEEPKRNAFQPDLKEESGKIP